MRVDPRLDSADIWSASISWRQQLLERPLLNLEKSWCTQISPTLQAYLGLSEGQAAYEARRAAFFRRERALHDALLLDLPTHQLRVLVDGITAQGFDDVLGAVGSSGLLLLSLHYHVFAWLLLWLGRSATLGRLAHKSLTMVLASQTGDLRLPRARIAELQAAGLCDSGTTLLDIAATPGSARRIVAELKAGGVVLLLVDAPPLPAPDAGSPLLGLDLGQRTVGLRPGAARLAAIARCAVASVRIQPRGDAHEVIFNSSVSATTAAVQRAIGDLAAQITSEPAAWAAWEWLQ